MNIGDLTLDPSDESKIMDLILKELHTIVRVQRLIASKYFQESVHFHLHRSNIKPEIFPDLAEQAVVYMQKPRPSDPIPKYYSLSWAIEGLNHIKSGRVIVH